MSHIPLSSSSGRKGGHFYGSDVTGQHGSPEQVCQYLRPAGVVNSKVVNSLS